MMAVAMRRAATAARCRDITTRKLVALPVSPPLLRRVLLVVLVALVATACKAGNGHPGPTGKPETVVRDAPDITFATRKAHVVGAAPPHYNATGTVTFATGDAKLVLEPKTAKLPPFGVLEPVAVIDLLRGVVAVRSYGGAEVQGVGTKRYEVDIDLFKAIVATPLERRGDLHLLDGRLGDDKKLWADVFVDGAGRVRRVLLPLHTDMIRPYGSDQRIPQLVSVDYSDFGGTK